MLFDQKSIDQLLSEDKTGRALFRHCAQKIMDDSTPFPFTDDLNKELTAFFEAIKTLPWADKTRIRVKNEFYDFVKNGVFDRVEEMGAIKKPDGGLRFDAFLKMGLIYGRGLIGLGHEHMWRPSTQGLEQFDLRWLSTSGVIRLGGFKEFTTAMNEKKVSILSFPALTLCEAKRKIAPYVFDKKQLDETMALLRKEQKDLPLNLFLSYRNRPRKESEPRDLPRDIFEIVKGYYMA